MPPPSQEELPQAIVQPLDHRLSKLEGQLAALKERGGGNVLANIVSVIAVVIALGSAAIAIFQTRYLREQTFSDNVEKKEALHKDIQSVEAALLVLISWKNIIDDAVSTEALEGCQGKCMLVTSARKVALQGELRALNLPVEKLTDEDGFSQDALRQMAYEFDLAQYVITEANGEIILRNLSGALTICGYIHPDVSKLPTIQFNLAADQSRWAGMQLAEKAAQQFVNVMQSSVPVVQLLDRTQPTSRQALDSLGSATDALKMSLCGLGKVRDLSDSKPAEQQCSRQNFDDVLAVKKFLDDKLEEAGNACKDQLVNYGHDLASRYNISGKTESRNTGNVIVSSSGASGKVPPTSNEPPHR